MNQGQPYTRETLTSAAASCGSIDEVIAYLGRVPYGKIKRHLRGRFAHFGIDISHLAGSRTPPPRPSRDELRQAVGDATSYAAALRSLGLPGRARPSLREWLAEEGITTAHFLGQAHQRGRHHPARRPAEEILVRGTSDRRTPSALLRRALRDIGRAEECDQCGTGPHWYGRPMTLEMDHINGDWRDNRAENLRFLCPNCHAITPTWCRGRGKGDRSPHSAAESLI